jgi:hypothetical protein
MNNKVTKGQINRAIAKIKDNPEHANLNAGAQLMEYKVEFEAGGTLFYRGGVYPDQAALTEELLIDLGIESRTL